MRRHLPASTAAQVVGSDKKAKQFTQLKRGQLLEFELSHERALADREVAAAELESLVARPLPPASATATATAPSSGPATAPATAP